MGLLVDYNVSKLLFCHSLKLVLNGANRRKVTNAFHKWKFSILLENEKEHKQNLENFKLQLQTLLENAKDRLGDKNNEIAITEKSNNQKKKQKSNNVEKRLLLYQSFQKDGNDFLQLSNWIDLTNHIGLADNHIPKKYLVKIYRHHSKLYKNKLVLQYEEYKDCLTSCWKYILKYINQNDGSEEEKDQLFFKIFQLYCSIGDKNNLTHMSGTKFHSMCVECNVDKLISHKQDIDLCYTKVVGQSKKKKEKKATALEFPQIQNVLLLLAQKTKLSYQDLRQQILNAWNESDIVNSLIEECDLPQ